jgi:uncharacterized protein YcbX
MTGTVAKLWRYPVKSMLGEDCEHIVLDERGVSGDRLFAVRDADGKLGSGKTTRRFRRIDGLFEYCAIDHGDVPRVTLSRESHVSHFDAAPLHLLTTASLAWLQGGLSESRVDERRFRPNVLIDIPGETQLEREWLGKTICIGNEVRLQVRNAKERCVMVGMAQADLPDDARVLRKRAQDARSSFGIYALTSSRPARSGVRIRST